MASTTDKKPTLYGWYSRLADISSKRNRTSDSSDVYYNTPTGDKVKVTCVNESYTESGTKWTDIKCIGEVTTYAANQRSSLFIHDE